MRAAALIALASVVSLAAAPCAQARAPAPDKLYSTLAPSVWRVFAFDGANKLFSQGSGVVIGADTIVTNCHVLEKAASVAVGKGKTVLPARLQYSDPTRDVCQITVKNLNAPAVTLGDSDSVAVGQRIYAIGNPLGLELTLSDGLVSGLRRDEDGLRYIQISAPISHGSSGGGLFDDEGRLIGITSAGLENGQNLNLALPVKWVQDLPRRTAADKERDLNRIRARLAALGKPPAPAPAPAPTPAPTPAPRPAAPAPAPAPASASAAAAGHLRTASGYAAINDVGRLLMLNPQAGAAYEQFLTRPLPRAFALGVPRGWWSSWTTTPKFPGDDPDPAVRVLTGCEKFHKSPCVLYAVDNVVVYRPASGFPSQANRP